MQFWSKLKFYLAIINKHSRVYGNESGMRTDNNPAGDTDAGRPHHFFANFMSSALNKTKQRRAKQCFK